MKSRLSLLLCLVVLATGCPKYRPKVDFENPGSFLKSLNAHIIQTHHSYECYRFGPAHVDALGKSCAGFVQDPEKAKGVRNELLEDAIPYIDSAYIDFITDLQAGRDRTNFIADLVELGTSGAVGVINGERPLQILGVALTAFRGGRRSADLNFYKEQSTPVLITKMDGNRAKVRVTILNREKGSVEDYPLGAAISDLVDYYNAGTLVRAFTQLQQDAAIATKQSEDEVLRLKGVPITGEITKEQHDLLILSAGILTTLGNDLTNGTAAEQAAATSRLKNIVAALEKDKAALAALKNVGAASADTDGVKLITALIDIRASATMVNDNDLLNTINRAIVDIKK